VVAERGDEAIAKVKNLTSGDGTPVVIEAVGRNITLTGGPAPVRAYIEELLPEILDGRLELTAGRLQRNVAFVEAGEYAGDDSGLDDALDAAYRDKYGRSSSAVAAITADVARATTLRVDPA
jgi:hypothetical protein